MKMYLVLPHFHDYTKLVNFQGTGTGISLYTRVETSIKPQGHPRKASVDPPEGEIFKIGLQGVKLLGEGKELDWGVCF